MVVANSTITSNRDDVIIPAGLHHKQGFISDEESKTLIDLISQNEWTSEGFEDRRRVQRYNVLDFEGRKTSSQEDNLSKILLLSHLDALIDRLLRTMTSTNNGRGGLLERPNDIVIEERKSTSRSTKSIFYKNKVDKNDQPKKRPIASIFESNLYSRDTACSYCNAIDHSNGNGQKNNIICSCYVAQISLVKPCTLSLNKPKERNIECWDLESPRHSVDITVNPNDLIVKEDEVLWNWRSCIIVSNEYSAEDDELLQTSKDNNSTHNIIIKFRCIQGEKHQNNEMNQDLNQNANIETQQQTNSNIPFIPLHELLTIIVTTSPIKSNPSTELLEKTFETFVYGGFDFAYNCKKVIICDGVRIQTDTFESSPSEYPDSESNSAYRPEVTKKHSNIKQSLRNGIATCHQANNYELFKEKLKQICEDAGSGILDEEVCETKQKLFSPFRNTRVVELEERHGYGFALRHALRHEITTPYVCVIQHDRTFMRVTPMKEVVHSMRNSKGNIKYVGMSMRSNLCYRDIFTSKYGGSALNELLEMVITPPELALDSKQYGPLGVTVKDMLVYQRDIDKMEKNLTTLAQTYRGTIQGTSHCNRPEIEQNGLHQLSLTPTLFWYDNTHICLTEHYRDFIFDPKYKMVARGGFVEDKLSPKIKISVERLGLKKGHSRFACYLLDDHSGYFFTGHLDGGSFMTSQDRQRLIAEKMNKK